jgi:hypothetical protein
VTLAWAGGGEALRRFVLMNTTPAASAASTTRPASSEGMVANPRRTRI